MNLEEQISKINSLIQENGRQINSGDTPDMSVLEKEMSSFLNSLKGLKATRAKDYLNLVQIWTVEIKKMSEALNRNLAQIQSEIGSAQVQNRATNAYSNAKKLSE